VCSVITASKRVLNDLPDPKRLLDEGAGIHHEATPKEIAEQIATDPVLPNLEASTDLP
jgi:hypothetical protein